MSTTSYVMACEHYSSSLHCCCDIFSYAIVTVVLIPAGKLYHFMVDRSEVKQWRGKVNLAIDWTHTVSASHTHCVTADDEEERLSPNGCQAELGKGWGGIVSTKSTTFHQWDEGFSSKQTQGWPGLTSLFSLCFKDMASQIASEFLSKSSRVQLDLAVLEHKQVCMRKAKSKKQKT